MTLGTLQPRPYNPLTDAVAHGFHLALGLGLSAAERRARWRSYKYCDVTQGAYALHPTHRFCVCAGTSFSMWSGYWTNGRTPPHQPDVVTVSAGLLLGKRFDMFFRGPTRSVEAIKAGEDIYVILNTYHAAITSSDPWSALSDLGLVRSNIRQIIEPLKPGHLWEDDKTWSARLTRHEMRARTFPTAWLTPVGHALLETITANPDARHAFLRRAEHRR